MDDERAYAERWCEANFAQMEAGPDGNWHVLVYSEGKGANVEGFGAGFLGAFEDLLSNVEEEHLGGDFNRIEGEGAAD